MPRTRGQQGMQQGATSSNNISAHPTAIERYLRNRNELTERQRNAVALLLQGHSDQEVAGQLNVDRTTIFRWRKSVAFAREMDRQRKLIWEQSVTQIQSMVQPALTILHRQLTSDDPQQAMRAASVLLRFATPSRLLAPSATTDASKSARQFEQDLFEYIDSPMPGQPGAPEDEEDLTDDEE